MKKAKIENSAVIIPNYNHGEHLQELIAKLSNLVAENQIFVIDDCSSQPLPDLSVNIHKHKKNMGKGAAIKSGFLLAIEKGFDFAITIDADLQHKPEDILGFIAKQNERYSQLVIGSRDFSFAKMPFMRVLSNTITSAIVSFVSGRKIIDSQSGYRLYQLDSFKMENLQSNRYQFETEIILEIIRNNGRVNFVPIETIYSGQISHISHLRDIWYFIKVIINNIKNKWR